MNDKQGIYWYQGMFMQPQHFQLADLHAQFRSKPLMETGLPHFWGVGDLELSQSAIANRAIEITRAQLLFPDHSYVEFPGNAVIASRSFDSAWTETDKPLTVYLGLKKLSVQEKNVTLADALPASAVPTRYISLGNPPEVPDLYSEGPSAQVRTLQHVVRIFFDGELEDLGDYDLIPIARLARDGDAIRLAGDFIPPCYALGASETLALTIRDIRDELAGRARQLQEYKSSDDSLKTDFDPSYLTFLLALRSLNRASPYLFHLIETPQAHPWLVYGALRQLVGELSSFSLRFNMLGESEDGAPGLPPYDHANLGYCFTRVRALIGSLLNEITIGPEYLAILQYENGLYAGELPRAFFDRRNRFYLVVRTALDPHRVTDGLLRDARLAAADDIAGLVGHALPGLELIHMTAAPQGLPRRASSYYFRIEQISQLWDAVEQQGRIALQWLDAPEDMKAEIVVLRR